MSEILITPEDLSDFSLEGCQKVAGGRSVDSILEGGQKVAGGRSVAKTTGKVANIRLHPGGGATVSWQPSRLPSSLLCSGGLRYATTTGYYRTALQAVVLPTPRFRF